MNLEKRKLILYTNSFLSGLYLIIQCIYSLNTFLNNSNINLLIINIFVLIGIFIHFVFTILALGHFKLYSKSKKNILIGSFFLFIYPFLFLFIPFDSSFFFNNYSFLFWSYIYQLTNIPFSFLHSITDFIDEYDYLQEYVVMKKLFLYSFYYSSFICYIGLWLYINNSILFASEFFLVCYLFIFHKKITYKKEWLQFFFLSSFFLCNYFIYSNQNMIQSILYSLYSFFNQYIFFIDLFFELKKRNNMNPLYHSDYEPFLFY